MCILHRHIAAGVLTFGPSRADAEFEAGIAQQVERGGLFRQDRRMTEIVRKGRATNVQGCGRRGAAACALNGAKMPPPM